MPEHGDIRQTGEQPPEATLAAPDRHAAAVTRSLAWAQASADRGDYAEALSWVQAVGATGDQLSPAVETKRQSWRDALAHKSGATGASLTPISSGSGREIVGA